MLGFWTIKYWKYCKHSHIFPMKHPDPLIKRQSDQVICFMKLNHDQVPAMVRFYFSPPPPPRIPILQRFKLTCKGIQYPFLQMVNDDCGTCCTARKIPFLIFFFLNASAHTWQMTIPIPQGFSVLVQPYALMRN